MTHISWYEAGAFAAWKGKRLPTEAEWEKAARGTDARLFPWGNEFDGNRLVWNSGRTQKVGTKPEGASPYGALDMAGNVYEWTSDWKEPYPNNPEVPSYEGGHTNAVLRGGSFYHTLHSYRTAKRFGFMPEVTYFHVGFRTAWIPPDTFDFAKYAVK